MFFLERQRHDLAPVEARQLCFSVGLVCAQNEKLVRHERDRQARAGVIYLVDFFWQERLLRKSVEARLADVNFCAAGVLFLALRRLLRYVIFRFDIQHLRFDTYENVFRYEDQRRFSFGEAETDLENAVVVFVVRKPLWQRHIHTIDLHAQRTAARERHALRQTAFQAQRLQHADAGARVCSALAVRSFQRVQFLQHRQRQHDAVILEGQQRPWALDQHIRIQYIGLLHSRSTPFRLKRKWPSIAVTCKMHRFRRAAWAITPRGRFYAQFTE